MLCSTADSVVFQDNKYIINRIRFIKSWFVEQDEMCHISVGSHNPLALISLSFLGFLRKSESGADSHRKNPAETFTISLGGMVWETWTGDHRGMLTHS